MTENTNGPFSLGRFEHLELEKINKRYVIKYAFIIKYPNGKKRRKIMKEDESYFFNNIDNQKNEINSFNTYFKIDQEVTLSEILRLTDIYYKLDTDSKKEVWSYFKAMTILSEDYIKLSK